MGHFLLFPAPHGGGFVAFGALLKLIPTYIPGWGGSGFTLTGALWTFARKYSNSNFFLKISPLKDDELVMSEM